MQVVYIGVRYRYIYALYNNKINNKDTIIILNNKWINNKYINILF